MDSQATEDLLNEVFATAWEIACKDGDVDSPFWAHVRLLAERCRTDDDWQGLLGVLLQISLSDKPAPLDREPIYRWSVDQRARHGGLRASRPRRKRADGQGAAERHRNTTADRKTKRARLRLILDGGAPEAPTIERDELARWVLDDAEASDVSRAEERELLANEQLHAMRKLIKVANEWKAKAEGLEIENMKMKAPPEEEDIDFGTAEDTLRAGAPGGGGAAVGGIAEGAAAAEGGGGGAAAGGAAAGGKKIQAKASQLKLVDEYAEEVQLERLGELLTSDHEDVCVKAALAIASLCARDEERCARLAEVGALPRIVALLDHDEFSNLSLLDVLLCLKALTSNRMHHPSLLKQLCDANGPRRLVKLVGSQQPELRREALQIVRSLVDHKPCRDAFVSEAGVLPPLLRCLRPNMPSEAIEPAAAAVAILTRFEPTAPAALLEGGGLPSLVQLLGRGGGSLAAHSAAAALAAVCRDGFVGADAQRAAREAGALAAVLPLLDGVLGGSAATAATASAACGCLGALCTGSSALASELRELGGLQSVVGLLSSRAAPNGLKASACEALGAAAENDAPSCAEIKRLGALPLLATLVKGGTSKVAAQAQAVLQLLTQRGDDDLAADVERSMREASTEGAPLLVNQLTQGHKLARRAALKLDSLAKGSSAARAQIVKLGAVPRLVKLVKRGHADEGTLNALGCLEVLAHGAPEVQDEARVAGIFGLLPDLLRPLAGGEGGEGGPPAAAPATAPTTAGGHAPIRVKSGPDHAVMEHDHVHEARLDDEVSARWRKSEQRKKARGAAAAAANASVDAALAAHAKARGVSMAAIDEAALEAAAEAVAAPAAAPVAYYSSDEEAPPRAEDGGGSGAPPDPTELRHNAALCLSALVSANAVSREAAKAAGCVEAVATLLDEGKDTQGAYLAAMALQALGLKDAGAQEMALKQRQQELARPGTPEHERLSKTMPARVQTVRSVWKLSEEPEHWGGAGIDPRHDAPARVRRPSAEDERRRAGSASTGGRRGSVARR